jgi:hypothetical protein
MNELITKRNSKQAYTHSEEDDVSKAKKIHSDLRKKQIKLKINYCINQINVNKQNSEVNKILEEISKESITETEGINEIVSEEMYKQGNNFKYRLAQKRRRNPIEKKNSQILFHKLPNEVNLVEFRMKRCLTVQNRHLGDNDPRVKMDKVGYGDNCDIPIGEEDRSGWNEKNKDGKEKQTYSSSSCSEKYENNEDYVIVIENTFEEKKNSELDEIFKKIEIQENINETLNENDNENLDENFKEDKTDGKEFSPVKNLRNLSLKDLNASIYKIDESVEFLFLTFLDF